MLTEWKGEAKRQEENQQRIVLKPREQKVLTMSKFMND